MSGDRTGGFFRRGAEGRDVSGDSERAAESRGEDRTARGFGRADEPGAFGDPAAGGRDTDAPDAHGNPTASRTADTPPPHGDPTAGRSTDAPDASSDRSGGFFRRGSRHAHRDQAGRRASDSDRTAHATGRSDDETDAGDERAGGSGWRTGRPDAGGEQTGRRIRHPADDQETSGHRTADSAEAEPKSAGRSKDAAGEGNPDDGLAEFAAELKLLAEAVLERVEPVLRQAADGQVEWSSCSWCPVCAAAALMRGQHHEVLQAVADHGTALVTVLREALAGVPVDPVMPEPDAHQHNHGAPQDHSAGASKGTESTAGQHTSRAGKRSRYVGIPVTIKA